jgi:hypothetical protein
MLTSARKSRSAEPGGIAGKPGKITERAVVVIETETEEAVLPFSVTCAGVPPAVGANVTLIVQCAPAARLVPQLLVSANRPSERSWKCSAWRSRNS